MRILELCVARRDVNVCSKV